ncbi:MAG: tRNA uridine-5-carboxymethylaminomethyl(34) synthesis GTPase MnmE [Planctomycetota bacterium]|nr:MAG: tRNA uridine-5-carboxymethylaminomethyl(34) synthesis GTPase MnmE [Planctomycetota bacterium]
MFFPGDERLDTIVAPATAQAPGHRAVVRVAGPEAISVARAVFEPLAPDPPGAWVFEGQLRLPPLVLAAQAWVFRAPRSYTGDDTIELHLVSSPPIVQRLLEQLCAAGARLARPGEFSRRAFLAGRLDLAQLEAVATLSTSASRAQVRAAAARLRGALRRRLDTLRETLLGLLAELEAALDFADQDLDRELLAEAQLGARLRALEDELGALLASEARHDRRGVVPQVVLHGAPNAGKSSLFNALCGERRAIVSPLAGTTRDAVRAEIELAGGLRVELCDPAGIEAGTGGEGIDAQAQRRAAALAAHADLVLQIFDASAEAPPAGPAPPAGATVLSVLNKIDLGLAPWAGRVADALAVSARTGAGLGRLRAAMAQRLIADDEAGERLTFDPNARHRVALQRAAGGVAAARAVLERAQPAELAAIELRTALDAIGEVCGESVADDVLDRIFSRFCIGK